MTPKLWGLALFVMIAVNFVFSLANSANPTDTINCGAPPLPACTAAGPWALVQFDKVTLPGIGLTVPFPGRLFQDSLFGMLTFNHALLAGNWAYLQWFFLITITGPIMVGFFLWGVPIVAGMSTAGLAVLVGAGVLTVLVRIFT